ncbi:hypothetical protein Bca101_003174 [Brassica carinata]
MAATEGQQVMALISKRLRTHRKKYNRITEMEESISQGKTLNKEQKETILSKPIVTALNPRARKAPPSSSFRRRFRRDHQPPSQEKQKAKGIHLFSLSARKEIAPEEKDVTSKTDMEDCKVSDEVSKDDISPCSESSQDVTPSPPSTSSGKARRKKKSKKPQTTN